MQKVVGSSPIIRFAERSANADLLTFCFPGGKRSEPGVSVWVSFCVHDANPACAAREDVLVHLLLVAAVAGIQAQG